MTKRVEDFKVKRYLWLNYENYILVLEGNEELPSIEPGNFAELQVPNAPGIFLRRPFSIFDVNYTSRTVSFYIKVVGQGSRQLGMLKQGDKVNMIYPLGNSFPLPEGKRALLVGGGSGLAPFLLLGRRLKKEGITPVYLIGGRNKEAVALMKAFEGEGEILVTTEDGTVGFQGVVTDHPVVKESISGFDHIYACGPEAMMKAVAGIAAGKNIPCHVSLENTMACGFGACLCCAVATREGHKMVCKDGPVFNANELKWQI